MGGEAVEQNLGLGSPRGGEQMPSVVCVCVWRGVIKPLRRGCPRAPSLSLPTPPTAHPRPTEQLRHRLARDKVASQEAGQDNVHLSCSGPTRWDAGKDGAVGYTAHLGDSCPY